MLVYAVGDQHRLREPCRAIVHAADKISATTTVEVIQEFVHVRARRRSRSDAVELGNAYAELFGPLLVPGRAELEEGLRLFVAHPEIGAFDAVLAATAMRAGAEAMVSADTAFADLAGLRYLDPAEPQTLERLGI